MPAPFLELRNLKTHFPIERGVIFHRHIGTVRAVDGVNLSLREGEILGLVGESGCGKSTLGRTILQLIPPTAGAVILAGRNLAELQGDELRKARSQFQMIFQDPYASLNPRMTVYDALAEAIQSHKDAPRRELPGRVSALMEKVGLSPRYIKKYPHEFSGGQRQRVAIARCLTLSPEVLVLDEAVSALDVSVQAQVLNLLKDLQDELGLAYIFISHDLAVVRFMADEVLVMKDGEVVEQAGVEQILERPQQEYTRRLLTAIPRGYVPAAA